jgi:GT2 family glycosyltransferase
MRSSVVVVTFNHRRDIEHCLRALLPTLSPRDEVIVVDNASTDGTADFVGREFQSVRLIRRRDNPGFGAACNHAADTSEAEYLVFLNPDTEPLPGWLDQLLHTLQSDRTIGLATPKLLLRAWPDHIDAFGHEVHISGIATCRGWGQPANSHMQLEQVAAVSGACFAIPRELFLSLGGFDDQLFLYYEDDDLSLRARLAGYSCVAVPNSHVEHDHTPGFPPNKLRYLERNRLWTTLKLYRGSTLLALVPVMVGAELLAWGMAIRSGPRHVLAKLHAWWDVLSWLPSLPRARKRIDRVVPDHHLLRAHTTRLAFGQVVQGPLAHRAERLAGTAFGLLSPR